MNNSHKESNQFFFASLLLGYVYDAVNCKREKPNQ